MTFRFDPYSPAIDADPFVLTRDVLLPGRRQKGAGGAALPLHHHSVLLADRHPYPEAAGDLLAFRLLRGPIAGHRQQPVAGLAIVQSPGGSPGDPERRAPPAVFVQVAESGVLGNLLRPAVGHGVREEAKSLPGYRGRQAHRKVIVVRHARTV